MQSNEKYSHLTALFIDCGKREGLELKVGTDECANAWSGIVAANRYVPIDYVNFFIDYQCAYLEQAGDVFDMKTVIFHDRKPIGIWPLVVLQGLTSGRRLGSNAGSLLAPWFVDGISFAIKQKIGKALYKIIKGFCAEAGILIVESGEMLGPINSSVSAFGSEMARNARILNVSHFLYVDLAIPIENIWANFRKSYKGLINNGKKIWMIGLMDEEDNATWEEFRQLHIKVAGRETRSLVTWNLQHKSIAERNGFLIHLRNESGVMVGGGFFQHTRAEGVYAVGAYDRSLFDLPLGHVVQHAAIVEMQKRHLQWYKLGQRHYPASSPAATEKEIAISLFKSGFATHEFVRIDSVAEFAESVQT